MDPDEVIILQGMPNYSGPNVRTWCISLNQASAAFKFGTNPLDFMFPLLLLQISLASGAIILTFYLLKPLGQSFMLAQILGGIIVGPSFLCRIPGLFNTIFPFRSFILIVVSAIGFMFYFFLVGVRTDIWVLTKINRQNFAIGFFAMAVSIVLTVTTSKLSVRSLGTDGGQTLTLVAIAESVISFPIIST